MGMVMKQHQMTMAWRENSGYRLAAAPAFGEAVYHPGWLNEEQNQAEIMKVTKLSLTSQTVNIRRRRNRTCVVNSGELDMTSDLK
jgi:hypothetical protein